ncbi:MAG: hypothetical protein AABY83_07685 [Pseudomonadota bacterium]
MNTQRLWWGMAVGGGIVVTVLSFSLRNVGTVLGKNDGGKSLSREFSLAGIVSDHRRDEIKRDPFYGDKLGYTTPNKSTAPRKISAPPPTVSTAGFVEAIPQEAATIKYIGYLLRDGRTHALVLFAGEPLVVAIGNPVGGRFMVKRIEQDALYLLGQGSGETRVELSGE